MRLLNPREMFRAIGSDRPRGRAGRIIALLAALLLAAGCAGVPPRAPDRKTPGAAPEKPAAGRKAGDKDFFRVLTLPSYETAEEAFDKVSILGVPFHRAAEEFRKKAGAVRSAAIEELSPAVRAEVRGLKLGETSKIIESREGFSILQRTTRALYERALRLMERKKDAPALALLRRELALNPDNPDAWLALARMTDAAGEREEADAAYRKARALAPRSPVVANKYARYLVSQYRYEEAEALLRAAAEASPDDAGVLLNLASLLVYLNRELDYASRLIERGAGIDPGRAAWYRLSGVIRKRRELGLAPKAAEGE